MLRPSLFTRHVLTSLLLIVCVLRQLPAAVPAAVPFRHDERLCSEPHAYARDDEEVSNAGEEAEVRELAKRFVQRLYETKDVAPLIDEFFVKNFLEHASPLDDKASHAALYSNLSDDEQRRLYIVALNFMYYASLSVINEDEKNSDKEISAYELFGSDVAGKLAALGEGVDLFDDADEDGHTDPADSARLREFISKSEKVLGEARDHLRRFTPDQMPELTRRSAEWKKDEAYGMKQYWDEALPPDAKAFQVFLPILLDIVVVKVDGRWEVWAMFSDGD